MSGSIGCLGPAGRPCRRPAFCQARALLYPATARAARSLGGAAALRLRSLILQVPSPVMVLLAAVWRASSLALARAPTAHGVAAHW